jgi:antitoxin component HigA of HigAB toxin-antitoxin module
MANRFSDWQEDLSVELIKSKKRRKMYFEALQEEYDNDLDVLRAIVKVMGLKEFSNLCGLPSSNISNYLKKGKDLKISTIKKLITPFGIKVVNIPLDQAA